MDTCLKSFLWDNGHEPLELEWRIGHMQGHFRPGVSEDAWERLRAKLDASPAFSKSYIETKESLGDSFKRIEAPGRTVLMVKKRVADYDVAAVSGPWTIRTSLCYEAVTTASCPTRFERHKRRWSYRHMCWSVDLTRVRGNLPDQLDSDSDICEVELELLDKDVLLERPLAHVLEWGAQIAAELCGLML
ncbi:hypothetical protein ACK3TF_004629 [Chlorella vulgaris]